CFSSSGQDGSGLAIIYEYIYNEFISKYTESGKIDNEICQINYYYWNRTSLEDDHLCKITIFMTKCSLIKYIGNDQPFFYHHYLQKLIDGISKLASKQADRGTNKQIIFI